MLPEKEGQSICNSVASLPEKKYLYSEIGVRSHSKVKPLFTVIFRILST